MNFIPMLMGDGLRRNAWKFPVKIAAKDRFREITYADLNARVNQLAHGLLSLGVRKGDAVALSVGNRIEHLEIVFATAKVGALAIPVDVKWKALELASVVAALEPRFIVLQEDCVEEFDKGKELKDLSLMKAVSLPRISPTAVCSMARAWPSLMFASMKTIPSRSCSHPEPRDFPKVVWRRTGPLFFTVSTTPLKRGSARMIKLCFLRRSISTPADRLLLGSSTLAGR